MIKMVMIFIANLGGKPFPRLDYVMYVCWQLQGILFDYAFHVFSGEDVVLNGMFLAYSSFCIPFMIQNCKVVTFDLLPLVVQFITNREAPVAAAAIAAKQDSDEIQATLRLEYETRVKEHSAEVIDLVSDSEEDEEGKRRVSSRKKKRS